MINKWKQSEKVNNLRQACSTCQMFHMYDKQSRPFCSRCARLWFSLDAAARHVNSAKSSTEQTGSQKQHHNIQSVLLTIKRSMMMPEQTILKKETNPRKSTLLLVLALGTLTFFFLCVGVFVTHTCMIVILCDPAITAGDSLEAHATARIIWAVSC